MKTLEYTFCIPKWFDQLFDGDDYATKCEYYNAILNHRSQKDPLSFDLDADKILVPPQKCHHELTLIDIEGDVPNHRTRAIKQCIKCDGIYPDEWLPNIPPDPYWDPKRWEGYKPTSLVYRICHPIKTEPRLFINDWRDLVVFFTYSIIWPLGAFILCSIIRLFL